MARFGAVEQCSDRDAQNGRNLNQPPGSDPVGADLVFRICWNVTPSRLASCVCDMPLAMRQTRTLRPTATPMKFGLLPAIYPSVGNRVANLQCSLEAIARCHQSKIAVHANRDVAIRSVVPPGWLFL
jgi:hypothetical protein